MATLLGNVFETIEEGDFSYADHRKGEREIIIPQLQKLGYSQINFFWFEPLIRGIAAIDPQGFNVEFWYG